MPPNRVLLVTHYRWHIEREDDRLTLARRLPARFDFAVERRFPLVARGRLAHQIRQDMWRALQSLRGFSPVVEVARSGDGLQVKAGGQVDGGNFPKAWAEGVLSTVLENAANQARWVRNSSSQRLAA